MKSHRTSVLALAAVLVLAMVFASSSACESGGGDGDRCNPLVLRDECDDGLHCTAASCTESYCCAINGSSTDPHCHAEGCSDLDAAADAADDGG